MRACSMAAAAIERKQFEAGSDWSSAMASNLLRKAEREKKKLLCLLHAASSMAKEERDGGRRVSWGAPSQKES